MPALWPFSQFTKSLWGGGGLSKRVCDCDNMELIFLSSSPYQVLQVPSDDPFYSVGPPALLPVMSLITPSV